MKTILAATDFSPASHNACVYATALAKAFRARLILFHAFQKPLIPVVEQVAVISSEDMKMVAEQSLQKEMSRLDPAAETELRYDCGEGLAVTAILKAAAYHKADIIITGMKKKASAVRKIMGSTVTDLMNKSNVPVMIVPEGKKFKNIETIVLAYESDLAPDDDMHLLDTLRSLAHRFKSKLYLVHVAKTEFKEIYQLLNKPSRFISIMHTLDPVFETLRSRSVTAALEHFMADHRVNLLVLMPEKKGMVKRLFSGSITRAMAFKTETPLLVLSGFHTGKNYPWTKSLAKNQSSVSSEKHK